MTLAGGVRMGRKRTMASFNGPSFVNQRSAQHPSQPGIARPIAARRTFAEGDHQLEKLEFALAVAVTRGDQQRSEQLRAQIAALGGNREEPGT
jgi:hypothetical protein